MNNQSSFPDHRLAYINSVFTPIDNLSLLDIPPQVDLIFLGWRPRLWRLCEGDASAGPGRWPGFRSQRSNRTPLLSPPTAGGVRSGIVRVCLIIFLWERCSIDLFWGPRVVGLHIDPLFWKNNPDRDRGRMFGDLANAWYSWQVGFFVAAMRCRHFKWRSKILGYSSRKL